MRFKHIIWIIVLVAGCATPTPYQPQRTNYLGQMEDGYDDFPINHGQNIYEIQFHGNQFTLNDTLQKYAQRRANEVCQAKGFHGYEALSSSTECSPDLLGSCVKNSITLRVKCK